MKLELRNGTPRRTKQGRRRRDARLLVDHWLISVFSIVRIHAGLFSDIFSSFSSDQHGSSDRWEFGGRCGFGGEFSGGRCRSGGRNISERKFENRGRSHAVGRQFLEGCRQLL